MVERIIIDVRRGSSAGASMLRKRRGMASIEFVWSAVVLVFVMMFIFRIFQVTIRGSGGLVKARHAAFSVLGGGSTAPGMQGREGLVYTEDLAAVGASVEQVEGCLGDCENKLLFKYVGSERHYPYGLSGFNYRVKQGLAVYLQ